MAQNGVGVLQAESLPGFSLVGDHTTTFDCGDWRPSSRHDVLGDLGDVRDGGPAPMSEAESRNGPSTVAAARQRRLRVLPARAPRIQTCDAWHTTIMITSSNTQNVVVHLWTFSQQQSFLIPEWTFRELLPWIAFPLGS